MCDGVALAASSINRHLRTIGISEPTRLVRFRLCQQRAGHFVGTPRREVRRLPCSDYKPRAFCKQSHIGQEAVTL